jgi:site-specific DNA-methyltransferase (adenine-specific)
MNQLFYGDNLDILKREVAEASVDLVYLDPPFNSNATYNVLFKAPSGEGSRAQIEAFEDSWHWNESAEEAYWQVLHGTNTDAARMLEAMRAFLGENDMMAYLAMMAVRLPTGSLYLHCDPTASHYLKILLDAVFGPTQFLNEVIWKRTAAHSAAKRWADVHDTILLYSKTPSFVWNKVLIDYEDTYKARYKHAEEGRGSWSDDNLTAPGVRHGDSGADWRGYDPTTKGNHWKVSATTVAEIVGVEEAKKLTTTQKLDVLDAHGFIHWPKGAGFPRFKRFLGKGGMVQDVVTDIAPLNSQAQERLGYPTQKPLALLERIISASSNPGNIVLDPFCGCGTTVHAAQKLGRRWIGIDVTHLAISLIERRLREAFPGIAFETHGVPQDIGGARALADKDKHEFQKWAITLIPDAQPWKGGRKGADTGIDGIVYLRTGKSESSRAIIEVKGGEKVSVDVVHKLKSVIEREKALVGLLVTLNEPSAQAEKEAVAAGFVEVDMGTGSMRLRRLQILTIEELMSGARPELPIIDNSAFRRAKREDTSSQSEFDV